MSAEHPRHKTQVLRHAIALIVSSGASSVLGLLFWGVASRRYSTEALGEASAAISAMGLLALIAQFNLKNVYTRFLPRAGCATFRFVLFGYMVSVLAGVVLAGGFLALGLARHFLQPGLGPEVLFVTGVALWVVFVLQDAVLASIRATVWLPVENTAYALLKLSLVAAVVFGGSTGILLAWVLSCGGAVGAVSVYLFWRAIPRHGRETSSGSQLPTRRALAGFVAGEYVASLATSTLTFLVPVLVVRMIGAKAGGYFIVPWLVGWGIQTLLWNVATAFVVDHGFDPELRQVSLARSVRFSLVVLGVASVALIAGAGPLLDILSGVRYAAHGALLLRLCVLASVVGALPVLYQTLVWVEGRVWNVAMVQTGLALAALTTMLALVGATGVNAPGYGLLAGQCAVAAVLVVPTRRKWRSFGQTPAPIV
ncbi:MAG: MATE family efflux transporter [Acidimicrobiales bacterium]